jgi:hypothetical protein
MAGMGLTRRTHTGGRIRPPVDTRGHLAYGRWVAPNDIDLQEKNNLVTTGQPNAAPDAGTSISTADALRLPLFDVLVGTSGVEIKHPPSLKKACLRRSGSSAQVGRPCTKSGQRSRTRSAIPLRPGGHLKPRPDKAGRAAYPHRHLRSQSGLFRTEGVCAQRSGRPKDFDGSKTSRAAGRHRSLAFRSFRTRRTLCPWLPLLTKNS